MAAKDKALAEHVANDPEVDSDRARAQARAKREGREAGVDEKGNRVAVSYREIFNATNGDEARAREIHRDLRRAGGFGDVSESTYMDIGSLERSVKEQKALADRAEDKYDRHKLSQAAQAQDDRLNRAMEALELLKKG